MSNQPSLHDILDAIGGMICQNGATGLDRTELHASWPKYRSLLLEALLEQTIVALNYDVDGLLEHPCVSSDEHAVAILLEAGLIERHERQWWHIGNRDPRPSGFYIKREALLRLKAAVQA